jgi:hypothetical protein
MTPLQQQKVKISGTTVTFTENAMKSTWKLLVYWLNVGRDTDGAHIDITIPI